MNKFWMVLGITLALIATQFTTPQPASAEEFDVADIRCNDLGTEDEIAMLLFWIDGYLSGKTGDTRFSTTFIEQLGEGIGDACAREPERRILAIVEDLRRH